MFNRYSKWYCCNTTGNVGSCPSGWTANPSTATDYDCATNYPGTTKVDTLCYGSVNASKCPNSDWEIDTSKGTDGHTYKCSNSVTDTLSGTTCSYTP